LIVWARRTPRRPCRRTGQSRPASEGGNWNRDRLRRPASSKVRKLLLKPLRGDAKFASQLGVEIAAADRFRR
jgi:hypothetical protein